MIDPLKELQKTGLEDSMMENQGWTNHGPL